MSPFVRRSNVLPVEAGSHRATSCPFGEKIIASSADGANLALIMTKMESARPPPKSVYAQTKITKYSPEQNPSRLCCGVSRRFSRNSLSTKYATNSICRRRDEDDDGVGAFTFVDALRL